MSSKQEFMEEMKADAMADDRRDCQEEKAMRNDYDYALDKLGLTEDSTIAELVVAVGTLNTYGYDLGIKEVVESLC